MKEQFENLAQRIFEEKSQKFSDLNMTNLKQLIEPFKLQIKDFEKRVEVTYSNERVERGTLKGEISKLIELNQQMMIHQIDLRYYALRGVLLELRSTSDFLANL